MGWTWTARTFVDAAGSTRASLLLEVPDVDAFFEIMKNPSKEVAEAGKSDGVRPETAVVFIERRSQTASRDSRSAAGAWPTWLTGARAGGRARRGGRGLAVAKAGDAVVRRPAPAGCQQEAQGRQDGHRPGSRLGHLPTVARRVTREA
jgi:hypothetical protein